MKLSRNPISFLLLIVFLAAFFIARHMYLKPRFVRGEKAPLIEGRLLDGSSFSLDELSGNYVLIDFWGSWCGPCRKENDEMVRFYQKYADAEFKKAGGFEIVSIGIEREKESWISAIKKDSLYWKYHISDLKRFKSPFAELYGVKQIPTKYLLSPDREIIGVNLSFNEMCRLLEKQIR